MWFGPEPSRREPTEQEKMIVRQVRMRQLLEQEQEIRQRARNAARVILDLHATTSLARRFKMSDLVQTFELELEDLNFFGADIRDAVRNDIVDLQCRLVAERWYGFYQGISEPASEEEILREQGLTKTAFVKLRARARKVLQKNKNIQKWYKHFHDKLIPTS